MIRKIILLGALVYFNVNFAQETEKNIDEVVLASRFLNLPYEKVNENIIVISPKEIQESPAQSIDEILQMYAGMDIRRRGANGVQSDVSVRGGTYEQVLILLNGVRMNDSQTGHNSLNVPVDLSSVEKIEIIKGPAARRFGQNAYSGVVNIVTKTSSDEKVKVIAEGGDFKTYSLALNSTFGSEKFQNLLQASSSSSDGYRYNTDYKIRNIFYQNRWFTGKGQLDFQAGFQEKKFGANGFYASASATEQYEEIQASVVSLSLTQNDNKFSYSIGTSWRRSQDMYLYLRDDPSYYRNMHIGNNVGAQGSLTYHSALGETGIGAEFRKEYLASSNLGHRERSLTQFFFEHHFSLVADRLKIIPGFSWADYSDSGSFFYPGIDIGFSVNEHHKLYGNIAKVHRIPTFTDLYYVSKTEQGNPDLKPENAVSTEIGYRFSGNDFQLKTSFFTRNSKNAIDWIKNGENEIWKAENVGNISTKGFEVEVNRNLPFVSSRLEISYTYLDNSFDKSADFSKYSAENLRHQFVANWDFRFLKNFSNRLTYRYLERVSTGSYNLLDEKLSYRNRDWEIYLLINNLTNADYTEAFGVPMPKRWFHVGVSYTILPSSL